LFSLAGGEVAQEFRTVVSAPWQSTQELLTTPIKIAGKIGSSLAYMIRDFLHRSDIPFE